MVADWQRGIDLERLAQFADLFKERHKALVFGAFGLVKERDVADYLARDCALWTGEPPSAVALFGVLRSASVHADFAGREVRMPTGTLFVRALAARDKAPGDKVLGDLFARAGLRPVVVEIFEEDQVAKQCVLDCGLAYLSTKIGAGSEIKGLYGRGVASPASLPLAETTTLAVLAPNFITADEHQAILTELVGADEFTQHYSGYNKRRSWTAFALHGYSDDPTFIIKPAEMSRKWREENSSLLSARPRWTTIADRFAATRSVADSLGLKLDRVRFMRLSAGNGELSRHADITDREAGVQDGRVTRLHIPIRTSNAVTFYGWTARGLRIRTRFPERALCYLDQRKPHAVKNTDPELDRIHLVVDCLADQRLRALIAREGTQT